MYFHHFKGTLLKTQLSEASMRMQVQPPASLSGLRIQWCTSYGVGHRHGSDLALLWLGCRPAVTDLIQPLAWEPPYAMGVAALKKTNKKSQKTIT